MHLKINFSRAYSYLNQLLKIEIWTSVFPQAFRFNHVWLGFNLQWRGHSGGCSKTMLHDMPFKIVIARCCLCLWISHRRFSLSFPNCMTSGSSSALKLQNAQAYLEWSTHVGWNPFPKTLPSPHNTKMSSHPLVVRHMIPPKQRVDDIQDGQNFFKLLRHLISFPFKSSTIFYPPTN